MTLDGLWQRTEDIEASNCKISSFKARSAALARWTRAVTVCWSCWYSSTSRSSVRQLCCVSKRKTLTFQRYSEADIIEEFTNKKLRPHLPQTVILTETIPKSNDPSNHCLPFITPGPKPCRIEMMNNMFTATSSVSLLQGKKILNWSLRPTFFATASELEGGIGFMTKLINPLKQSHPLHSAKSGKDPLFLSMLSSGRSKIFKVAMKNAVQPVSNYVNSHH